jgi:hypothetical protein
MFWHFSNKLPPFHHQLTTHSNDFQKHPKIIATFAAVCACFKNPDLRPFPPFFLWVIKRLLCVFGLLLEMEEIYGLVAVSLAIWYLMLKTACCVLVKKRLPYWLNLVN